MASSVFNPVTSDYYSVAAQASTWASARGAASGSSRNSTYVIGEALVNSTPTYTVERGFMVFNTAAIPNGVTIVSATLRVYVSGITGYAGANELDLVASTQASPTALATSDFSKVGSTKLATRIGITSAGWKTFTLNAAGLALISDTGYTKLAIRAALDLDNSSPVDGVSEGSVLLQSAEGTNPPELTVNYVVVNEKTLTDTVTITESLPKDIETIKTDTVTPSETIAQDTAVRFWVGGTGNWNDTDHWSTFSGGTGGASAPTATEIAIFDENSGTGTVTVNVTAACLGIDFTGYAGTFTGSEALTISGSATFSDGMTNTYSGTMTFDATDAQTITGGAAMTGDPTIVLDGVGGSWGLEGALDIGAGILRLTNGTFSTNDNDVTCGEFDISNSNTRVVNLGSSTIACTDWTATTTTGLTLNEGTSNISVGGGTFNGGGETYYQVSITDDETIVGSNTYTTLVLSAGVVVTVTAGTTQTVTNITLVGTASSNITLQSSVADTAFTISKSSGSVTAQFCVISDCTGAGGATYTANFSSDGGGNTNWSFLNQDLGTLDGKRQSGGILTSSSQSPKLKGRRAAGGFLRSSGRNK